MERKRIIEAIVGIIFLILLLLSILIIIQFSTSEHIEVEDSFNNQVYIKYYYENVYVSSDIILTKNYLKLTSNTIQNQYIKKETIDTSPKVKKASIYNSYSSHKKTSTLGLYTDTFVVNVDNLAGGQRYTVVWNFEDYWGNKRSYEDTKYIFGKDSQRFFFKDISKDSTYYYSWNYKVIPQLG